MKLLNYKTLEEQNYDAYLLKKAPERVLQFGEGNFLRAFADYFIDVMNEKAHFNSKVVLVQPIANKNGHHKLNELINAQDGLYDLYLRGFKDGKKINDKRIISCVSRCLNIHSDYDEVYKYALNPDLRFIICNTTEAGIVYDASCKLSDRPALSYPAKLTKFLYERYLHFKNEKNKGFIILACELIDDNGKKLKEYVIKHALDWELGEDFINWINDDNLFCSTLVDRIVTGYPKNEADELNKENGYLDNIIDTGEVFGLWVIEGPDSIKDEFPCDKADLPIIICKDHRPYKQRKVRILNGAHTSFVLGAFMAGFNIVRDCMNDETIYNFLNRTLFDEVIPTLTLPKEDCEQFAHSVIERFKNPFIDHQLLSISLNSTSKWKARVLPSLLGYYDKYKQLPKCLTASFAFYIKFYKGDKLTDEGLLGHRENGDEYIICDDKEVLEFFFKHKDDDIKTLVHEVASNITFWGQDLTQIPEFENTVVKYLNDLKLYGTYKLMKEIINNKKG